MTNNDMKQEFKTKLHDLMDSLNTAISMPDGQWSIKGFIDAYKNIYTISSDTKIISKILEIHLFPLILDFAEKNGYYVVPAQEQNWYPDLSFVHKENKEWKFAVDIKTTYRLDEYPGFCSGFTLGSHGEYFTKRTSTKNIQFPYNEYKGHFCLCIIYTRVPEAKVHEKERQPIGSLVSIISVVKDFLFFVREKWEIASDKAGSGNTANIGSISNIDDLVNGRGVFEKLGEKHFDEYWMNHGTLNILAKDGSTKTMTSIQDYILYKGIEAELINHKAKRKASNKQ